MRSAGLAFLVALALLASSAIAQQQAPGLPTTVQLPTFSYFAVETSVSIPDSGGAYSEAARQARLRPSPGLKPAGASLGSVDSRAAGQGRGVALAGSNVSASATIHWPDEPLALRNPAASRFADPFAIELRRQGASSAGRPALSIAEASAQRLAAQQAQEQAAMELIRQGDEALARGNRSAANVYYQSAARRAQGEARNTALARLQSSSESVER